MAIRLQVYQSTLEITCGEPVIEGGIRANEVVFTFSPDDTTWDGMARMAVFETRVDKRATLLADGRSCTIPWEVLAKGSAGSYLRIGLYGTEEDDDGVIVRSTIWADNPYRVLPGPDADPGKDPTPDQYQQMLALTSKVASRLDELDSVESSVKSSEQKAEASATAASSSAATAKNSAAAAQTSATAATGAKTGAEKAQGEAEKAKTAAAISAHNAQVWAEGGTLQDADGGDDPSGARDGAKQFAEKAEAAKELAVQSATSAAGAQADASQAAQEAATRANQAQQSASAADSSRDAAEAAAGSAKTSESNAKASETAAKASETNAKGSEDSAKASATAAKTSETNAKTSENSAGYSATAAKASADAAASSASEAADSSVSAEKSAALATDALGKGPYVDQSTKTWFVWDTRVGKFVDTGIKAEGKDGSTISATGLWGINVDSTGDLIVTYVGDNPPPLSLDPNGDLIYTLAGNRIVIGNVGGGTNDYEKLINLPVLNGVEFKGRITLRGLPDPAGPQDAGKVPVVNDDGTGWLLGDSDSGRDWRCLGTFTLPENAQILEITADEYGIPFEFSGEFIINAYVGAFFKNYTGAGSFVRITSSDGKNYDANIQSLATASGNEASDIDTVTPVYSNVVLHGTIINKKFFMSSLGDLKASDNAYSVKPAYLSVGLDCASKKFTKISIWRSHPDNKFFAGSKVSVSVR